MWRIYQCRRNNMSCIVGQPNDGKTIWRPDIIYILSILYSTLALHRLSSSWTYPVHVWWFSWVVLMIMVHLNHHLSLRFIKVRPILYPQIVMNHPDNHGSFWWPLLSIKHLHLEIEVIWSVTVRNQHHGTHWWSSQIYLVINIHTDDFSLGWALYML